jgi:hypothetical protein
VLFSCKIQTLGPLQRTTLSSSSTVEVKLEYESAAASEEKDGE